MDAVGEILLSLSYLPTAERLTVVVAKAKNLVWTNGRTTAGRTAIHASVLWLSSQVCSCLRFWQPVKTHVYLSGSMTVCLCLCLVLCLAVPLFCIYSCLFVCLLNFCFFQLLLLSLPQPLPLFFTFISLTRCRLHCCLCTTKCYGGHALCFACNAYFSFETPVPAPCPKTHSTKTNVQDNKVSS